MIKKIYKIYTVALLLSLPLLFLHKAEWTGVWDFLYHYVANPLFFGLILLCTVGAIKAFEDNYINKE